MSRKLKKLKLYSLLPLLAILFIAMEMPLVHPALHNHFDHPHIDADHCSKHLPPNADENKAHECPICNFLATCQLHASGFSAIITANGLVLIIVTNNHIFLEEIIPFSAKSRAPPAFILL
jgi:hypothetical protein